MVASTGSTRSSSSSRNSSMAAGRAADRGSVAGYSGKSSSAASKSVSSMAAGRAADRNSVSGYTSRSSFASSMAAGRAADRNSVAGYTKASPNSSMAAARAADRHSVAGYSDRSSFASSMAAARAADRNSVPGYANNQSSFASSMAAARTADRNSVMGYTHGSLTKGMQGDAVKSLQQRLSNSGYDVGAIDGKFGNRTAQALRSYQRSLGLGADGVAGRKTFEAMNGLKGVNSSVGKPVGGTVSTQLDDRGIGFTTYGPRSMQYGTPQTVQNLKDIAARYHARTGRTLEIGDLSKVNGGKTRRHSTHLNGTDVDIRPPSTTGGPTTWGSANYDRNATRALIEEVKRANPDARVLFNDPVLRNEGLTHYAKGHNDHLHVSFR